MQRRHWNRFDLITFQIHIVWSWWEMKLRSSFETDRNHKRLRTACLRDLLANSISSTDRKRAFVEPGSERQKISFYCRFVVCFSGSIRSVFHPISRRHALLAHVAAMVTLSVFIISWCWLCLTHWCYKTMEVNGTGRCNAQRGNGASNRGQHNKPTTVRFLLKEWII